MTAIFTLVRPKVSSNHAIPFQNLISKNPQDKRIVNRVFQGPNFPPHGNQYVPPIGSRYPLERNYISQPITEENVQENNNNNNEEYNNRTRINLSNFPDNNLNINNSRINNPQFVNINNSNILGMSDSILSNSNLSGLPIMDSLNFSINNLSLHSSYNDDSLENSIDEEDLKEIPENEINNVDKLDQGKKKCVICLENFKNGEKGSFLPCVHLFHSDCIKNWLKTNNTCPICNYKLTKKSFDE